MIDFTNKNVIVTGAASGIGKATAEGVVAGGGFAIIFDVNEEKGLEAVEELGKDKATFIKVDLADVDKIKEAVSEVHNKYGRIDALVNCAGIISTKPFDEIEIGEWNRVISLNLTAVFALSQTVYSYMKEQGGGRIVNVSSVAGKRGGGLLGSSAYAASKAGVIGLTKAIAREGAKHGISCNAVCPSFTETAMFNGVSEDTVNRILDTIPLHRGAKPAEIANVILFYTSDLASFVTGEISDVDGGVTMDG